MSRSCVVILVTVLCLVEPARAATTNNDDSCDIAVAPAATLLLPFFEIDVTTPAGDTTLFTITNVTSAPQIAHVTYAVEFDAAQLGNGCSAIAATPSPEIGPAGGIFVCPPGIECRTDSSKEHPYAGTNATP